MGCANVALVPIRPSKYALLTRQRLHDPLRTDNSKDQGSLDWSWSGEGGLVTFLSSHPMDSYAARLSATP
jgi:hypothetical protein